MMEWRKLDWLPDHEISEFGDVRRTRARGNRLAGSACTGTIDRKGYHRYNLVGMDGRRVSPLAHRLVCEAWHGQPPPGKDHAAHWDDDKTNNHYSNLRWASNLENAQDKVRNGRAPSGERHPQAVLNWEIVRSMRVERSKGATVKAVAEMHGVNINTATQVLYNYNWREERDPAGIALGVMA